MYFLRRELLISFVLILAPAHAVGPLNLLPFGLCRKAMKLLAMPRGESDLIPGHLYLKKTETVEDMVENGMKVTAENLTGLGIPVEMHKYYDPENGKFEYKATHKEKLSAENGSLPLDHVRLNLHLSSQAQMMVFSEYLLLMKDELALNLWVVVPKDQYKHFQAVIGDLPKQVSSRIKLIAEDSDVGDSPLWTQDHEKPLETESGYESLIPVHVWKENQHNGTIPHDALWRKTGYQYGYMKSPLQFEGGNVIVGQDRAFVGSDTIAQNMARFRISRQEAIAALSAEFNRPVYEIGSPSGLKRDRKAILTQPVFHIDMMMAVVKDQRTGKDVVLLESPKQSLRILARELPEGANFWTPNKFLLNKGIFDKLSPSERDFLNTLKEVSQKDLMEHQQMLDDIESDLVANGIEVKRVPGLSLHPGMENSDYKANRHFTWTNSIISTDFALIPGLGIEKLDNYAREIYESMGYRVHQMVSSQYTLPLLGGIRCVSGTYRKPVGSTEK
jgi:hypothetical protein